MRRLPLARYLRWKFPGEGGSGHGRHMGFRSSMLFNGRGNSKVTARKVGIEALHSKLRKIFDS